MSTNTENSIRSSRANFPAAHCKFFPDLSCLIEQDECVCITETHKKNVFFILVKMWINRINPVHENGTHVGISTVQQTDQLWTETYYCIG